MGPFPQVKLLPAYKRDNSTDCVTYLRVESVVIPAAERLL